MHSKFNEYNIPLSVVEQGVQYIFFLSKIHPCNIPERAFTIHSRHVKAWKIENKTKNKIRKLFSNIWIRNTFSRYKKRKQSLLFRKPFDSSE